MILLQVAAIILAFMTRKVKIKALNDSKYVAAIIYITSMVVVGLIVTTFALDSFIVVAEIMFSGGLMLATTVFVGLIFIPKVFQSFCLLLLFCCCCCCCFVVVIIQIL